MEIKIYCDAKVNIDKFNSAVFVECKVHNYTKEDETLSGEILIKGEFFKDNLEEKHPFSEMVPFSIVFKSPNYEIEDVLIEEFNFQEIVNLGLETNFNVIIRYHVLDDNNNDNFDNPYNNYNDDDYDDNDYDDDDYDDNDYDDYDDYEDFTVFRDEEKKSVPDSESKNNKESNVSEEKTKKDDKNDSMEVSNENELTKELISKKYDELLKNVLDSRTDNFFEQQMKSNVRIVEDDSRHNDALSFFRNMSDEYHILKVRYIDKESDLERLSKKEKVSIDKIYQDNKHSNFLDKRRIIIK